MQPFSCSDSLEKPPVVLNGPQLSRLQPTGHAHAVLPSGLLQSFGTLFFCCLWPASPASYFLDQLAMAALLYHATPQLLRLLAIPSLHWSLWRLLDDARLRLAEARSPLLSNPLAL
ncbi:hypothetical protein GOP47_0029803 [Adiantum capillus-veneris]|nr:hypothetical protein GOP47_0029803 [Adiantum capillus-veneris]